MKNFFFFFSLLSVSRWSELCQEKFLISFLHALLPPFRCPSTPFYCALRWICDAVNILNQVIVCVEICICVIKKKTAKYKTIARGVSFISWVIMRDVMSSGTHRGTWMKRLGPCVRSKTCYLLFGLQLLLISLSWGNYSVLSCGAEVCYLAKWNKHYCLL